MDSFYTYTHFYRILLSAGSLCYIVPHTMYQDRLSRKIVSGLLIVGIINFALFPITPFVFFLPLMAGINWFFLPTIILWILLYRSNTTPHFTSNQNWIIDSLRESILVLDPQLELLGSNRVVISNTFLTQICDGIRSGTLEGIISLGLKKYRYRCRSFHKGYLCSLVDLTDELELVPLLQDKNRVLNEQKFLLESYEEKELPIRKIQTESKISQVITEVVSQSLRKLDQDLQSPTNIRELIQSAESALGQIRKVVSQLREEEIS